MCFSERQSIINFIALFGYGLFLNIQSSDSDIWRLYIPLYFLSIKDLLQAGLYHFDTKYDYKHILSILSFVHICFQPLIVNVVLSYFSKDTTFLGVNYWNIIFLITFLYGCYELTNLDVFNIQRTASFCKDSTSDFCSDENSSYIGKYHVAYKFKTINNYNYVLPLLMILPALLTNSWFLSLVWLFFIIGIMHVFKDTRNGESGAIWCFLSIAFGIPLVYFRNSIMKLTRA
jgi:hypothetical protein